MTRLVRVVVAVAAAGWSIWQVAMYVTETRKWSHR